VLEELLTRRNEALLNHTKHILLTLYDAGIATDSQIVEWYESPTDHAVVVDNTEAVALRHKAKQFCEFLKEDMESSDEDEVNENENENENEEEEEEENGEDQEQEDGAKDKEDTEDVD